MLETKLGDLLNAGTRVVQHKKESPVSCRLPSVCRQTPQERLDFVALQKECLGRWRALDGDRDHLLRYRQVLRTPAREKVEERAQNRQAVIPRPPLIVSRGFKVLQKPKHSIERQGLAGDLRDSTGHIPRHKQEKETKPVAIRLRRPPVPLTLRQVDPLIRQLTLYRDLINRTTGDQ